MISIKNIQKMKTNDGHMLPVYRDWDIDTNCGHTPKMVYITSLFPGVEKDIILHERRSAYMTCIAGCVSLEAMINDQFENFILDFDGADDQVNLIIIPKNVPIKLRNLSKQTSIILNCPNPSWHPDDQDTIKFKSWSDFNKWKQKD